MRKSGQRAAGERRGLLPAVALSALVLGLAGPAPTPAGAAVAPFRVGAAVADLTPPCTGATGACPAVPAGFSDPADCLPAAGAVLTGPRLFAFEEPYLDQMASGHYDLGDPHLDCPVPGGAPDARWDGNFVGGGSNAPRYYDHVADPITARAMVVSNGSRTIAVEVLDHEGAFDVYLAQIRAAVARNLPRGASLNAADVYISSTHDESAPDTIGLYGVSNATSSVNPYWAAWMVRGAARAVVAAYEAMRPAQIRYADAVEPGNLRQCWSSYPFVDDQIMPTLQAVDASTGRPIVTLADVSQHAETLGFNGGSQLDGGSTLDAEKSWLSADWPYWFRHKLETDLGGVGIEMAGSVGSNETPQVFAGPISRTPQRFVDASHPAGCRTLFDGNGATVPLGYFGETQALGDDLAGAVESALASATYSRSDAIAGVRADVCIHDSNALFGAAGALGVFGTRPSYDDSCTVEVPALPNGTTAGTSIRTQVAAFRIGDGTFAAVPGEVFPVTYLRSFMGPEDFPCPDPAGGLCPAGAVPASLTGSYALPAWLMPHMHTPYRFIDGLAEDMIGYIFPKADGVGVPGEYPLANPQADATDRFGCGHSDDSEAASSDAASRLGARLAYLLDGLEGSHEDIETGRYVLPGGVVSRDPLGGPEVKCSVDTTYVPSGPATAAAVPAGLSCACAFSALPGLPGFKAVTPASWMSLDGRPQAAPDRNTRGFIDAAGVRHWLEVFPDLTLVAATATATAPAPAARATGLAPVSGPGLRLL
jgi:hypothetical protein